MKIIVTGGGTGGHIYPAIAIIEEIIEREPNTEILYIGSRNSIEQRTARNKKIKFFPINSYVFNGKSFFVKVFSAIKLIFSSFKVMKKMLKFKPDVVLGTGGYVTGPVMLAAIILRKKILLHEQNSIPGMANAFFAKFASKVFVSYSDSIDKFKIPRNKIEITGNPMRKSFKNISKDESRKKLGINDEVVILSIGGSGGSQILNDFVYNSKTFIDSNKNIIWYHATGKSYYKYYKDKLSGIKNLKVFEYLDNINDYYASADIVVSRSGAITLSEISTVGVASILVPSSNVVNDHQMYNAMSYKKAEASFVIRDNELLEDKTYEILNDLIKDNELRKKMAYNSSNLALLGAAAIIADSIILGE